MNKVKQLNNKMKEFENFKRDFINNYDGEDIFVYAQML